MLRPPHTAEAPCPRRGLRGGRLYRLFNVLFRLEMIQLFQTIMFGHRHSTPILACGQSIRGVTDLPLTICMVLGIWLWEDPEQLANVLVVVVTGGDELMRGVGLCEIRQSNE